MSIGANSSVDVETDRRGQELTWLITRVGWLFMLLLLIAALIGLTGSGGPMSRTYVKAGSARIDVPRISRWASADHMTVEFGADTSGKAAVTVPMAFIDIFTIEAVSPQPRSVIATPDGHIFEFDFADGAGKRRAQFSIRADSPAPPTGIGRFRVDDVAASEINVVVMP